MDNSGQARGPGRPTGEKPNAVRRALLDATRELCVEVGLDAASSKSIADRAGVNPAMINYYFDSKEGLCQAMMLDALTPLVAQLEAAGKSGASGMTIQRFVKAYMQTLSRNPWLPQLVVREVLPENGRFRELFFAQLATRAAALLPQLLEREFGNEGNAEEQDLQLTMISILSLAIFPFVAAPVLHGVLGVDVTDDAFVERLIAQSVHVVERGLLQGDSK